MSAALSWPALQSGDLVRLVSPASFPDAEVDTVAHTRRVLESWGLRTEVAPHAHDRWGYMAGHDADRLRDLDDAFRDPEVRAIVTTRGGAGAYRICDELDFDAVRADPKPLVGFSDITYLQLALWRECRLPSVHGWLVGDEGAATARALLSGGPPVVVASDPTAYSAKVRVGGVATGPLVGGNLASISHLVGAGLPDLRGAILLLEDKRDMGLGRIDRQLTQLRRAGALDGLAGVALGLFTGFDDYVDRGWALVDVLEDHLTPLGIPVLGGLRIGHNGVDANGAPDQSCVAIGADAVLDADAGTLRSPSPAV
jgi:muramoyltetrapeptide carboxypeptidase